MSGTMTLSADGMRRTKAMTKLERSRECKEDHACPKCKSSHHEHTSGHDLVRWLSMVDPLNLAVLQGIPIQRNNFTVKADHADHEHRCSCTPENVHLSPPLTFHSTPINSCHTSAN